MGINLFSVLPTSRAGGFWAFPEGFWAWRFELRARDVGSERSTWVLVSCAHVRWRVCKG